jgi:cation:H+ antiporter
MVLGNLLGSIVVNGTLVIGLAVLISPITISNSQSYLVSTMAFLLIFALFYFFVSSKKRLDHWEGALLLIVYFLFAFFEFRGF